jgi:thiamine kinase-like enzyme
VLQREHDRLQALRGRLPHGLAVTLPRPLRYADGDGWEALLLPWMSGRSPYVEMQSSLRPHASVRAHLQAAVDWLAGFQAFTSRAGRVQAGVFRLGLGHGDYWARNLLLRGDGVSAVLDWEGAREDRPVTEDLFHFLLTYGLNYRWLGKGRSGPEEAFARAFLQPSPVAEEVARVLLRYCTLSGLDRRLLRASFEAHLSDGTSDAALAPVLLDSLRRSAWSLFAT